jgi:sodium/potassium-transporting ATPase subunit alpha
MVRVLTWIALAMGIALFAYGVVADAIRARVLAFAFDTSLRRAGGVTRDARGHLFAIKGAWESVAPLLAAGQHGAEAAVHRLASQGYRVLAVASRPLRAAPAADAAMADLEHALTLDGLLCLEDPLRAEVPDAVARCHAAGIRVIMITGDHPDTAAAIARRAGITGEDAAGVITGADLARMRELDLAQHLQAGANVFARTTPEQKMKIVAALHELDLVVAVTGDGVNDAPALKAADVGIAMGQGGTDVARESAQVVLLDDNFASIVAGIEEGRTIFGNIRKFTNYVLVSNGFGLDYLRKRLQR